MAKTTHFCMGEEMDSKFSLAASHLDCGMDSPKSHQSHDEKSHVDPSGCCENLSQHLQLDEESSVKKSNSQVNIHFALAFIEVFIWNTTVFPKEDQKVNDYYPPPIEQDFQILFQSFLI
jgi:hypothetical protein